MNINDFKDSPKRVWVNAPSTNQIHNKIHGKVGIGVYRKYSSGQEVVYIYFTEGDTISMLISPNLLELESLRYPKPS